MIRSTGVPKKGIPSLLVISACFLVVWLSASFNGEEVQVRPNVLFISIDDLRPELGAYGNTEIHTPNLDRLASEGTLFSNAFCQVAVCAPSRASIMTGLRPDSSRVWVLGDSFRKNMPGVVTIPQHFRKFGYHTVSMGKIFHNHMPDSISFDEADLRPSAYSTPDMIDRDAESFYVDAEIRKEHALVREARIKKNPRRAAYGGGWAYGRSTECTEAPDSAFYDGAQTNLAIKKLRELKAKGQPFFLALGYYRPHLPFVAPKKYWDLYDRERLTLAPNDFEPKNAPPMAVNVPYELTGCYDLEYVKHQSLSKISTDTARLLKHGYYASVSYIDACLGKLMAALKELGLDKSTIVVVWGDHGWKLGEHNGWSKMTNYIIDTRVPLIVKAPSVKKKGKTDGLVELVDVYSTLCDLAGIETPKYLQGTSVRPLMERPDRDWKSAVFSQFQRRPRESLDGKSYMGYSMITRNHHYIEWYRWDMASKTAQGLEAVELYDLQSDPLENTNVAGLDDHQQLIKNLSAQLKRGWRAAIPK